MRWQACVALLVLAGPAGAWTQTGGGPGHSGIAELPPVLDVTGTANLVPSGFMGLGAQAFVAETPWGLLTLAQTGDDSDEVQDLDEPEARSTCSLALLAPDEAQAVALGAAFECVNTNQASEPTGPRLVGYASTAHLALVCAESNAEAGALRAFDVPSGASEWSIVPSLDAPPDLPIPSGNPEPLWMCHEPAIDQERSIAYVPFSREHSQGVVMAINLTDGTPVWQSAVIDFPYRYVDDPPFPELPPPPSMGVGTAVPLSVTMASHGLVILGYMDVSSNPDAPSSSRLPFGTMMGFDGSVRDAPMFVDSAFLTLSSDGDETSIGRALSRVGATNGARVAARVGHFLLIINTEGEYDGYPIEGAPEVEFFDLQGAPAWDRNLIAVPFDFTISLFDVSTLEFTAVSYVGQRVGDVVIDSRGLVHALYQQPTTSGTRPSLVTYHPFTHDIVQIHEFRPGRWQYRPTPLAGTFATHMAEVEDGLIVWDPTGNITFLGQADPALVPDFSPDTFYPEVNEPMQIGLSSEAGGYRIAWGDGTLDRFAPGEAADHIYRQEGDVEARITAILEDGRTATQQLVIHAGKDPPQRLNWAQTQFTPENQERTYFILGLVITLVGAAFAVLQKRRHRSLIQSDLVVLDELEKQAKADPVEARRDLADYERGLRERLAKGKMRDADYGILDRRVRDIASLLETRKGARAKV